MRKSKHTEVKCWQGYVCAAEGNLLLGGVRAHYSAPFCSASAAVRWTVIIAMQNAQSGRKVARTDVTEIVKARRAVVHGCQDGSTCSLREGRT